MGHSGQGIVKDQKGEEQPADKQRANRPQNAIEGFGLKGSHPRPQTIRRQ